MNETLPEGPFDAIYYGNTSHMYGPDENRVLFSRMRRSLVPGGLLAIREFVRGMSDDAALFAVNMLVLTAGGGTYTAEEYEEWLVGAGFEGVEYVPSPARDSPHVRPQPRLGLGVTRREVDPGDSRDLLPGRRVPHGGCLRAHRVLPIRPAERARVRRPARLRSLARVLRKGTYEVRVDEDFEGVIGACADREETWINGEIIEAYVRLHKTRRPTASRPTGKAASSEDSTALPWAARSMGESMFRE